MNHMPMPPRVWMVAVLALAGCGPVGEEPEQEAVATAQQAFVASNGRSLNGRSLNGRSLNGRSLNGRSLNGVSLSGVTVKGAPMSSTWLEGTMLHGVDEAGKTLKKKDFEGAILTAILDDQSTLELRIDSITPSPGDPSILMHFVSYPTDEGWVPLCYDGSGDPTTAIPLLGRWSYEEGVPGGGAKIDDPSSFTFACRDHALAKCVELGYAPWKSVNVKSANGKGKLELSLAGHHQACTRLIRADYCGDGSSHTVDGTLLNLYDGLGVQGDTESWSFEAEWDASGARCVSRSREPEGTTPACWPSLLAADCGARSHFASGALLMNEDAPLP